MSEQPDGPVIAALLAAAAIALAVAWWATLERQAQDEAPSQDAVHEPGMIEGPPGDAPLAPVPAAVEAPAAGASGMGAPGEPDAAIADAALPVPEGEFGGEAAPGASPGAPARAAPRELGTRGGSAPRGDSPVQARLPGDQGMPVPMQVAPPRPAKGGTLRTPPRPDPSPILRPRVGQ